MSTINSQTRQKIKGFLEGFIQNLVRSYKNRKFKQITTAQEYLSRNSSKGELRPFHAAILPSSLLKITAFERGFSTSLGSTFEEVAKLIAIQNHREAVRSYTLMAEVSSSALDEIERQKERYDRAIQLNSAKPSFSEMLESVINCCRDHDLEEKVVQVDLKIINNNNEAILFEIKSPKPNKGQCLEVLQRLLRFHLFTHSLEMETQAYYAMPYNPWGKLENYKWSVAKKYLPFDDTVLVGDQFWTVIGGEGTYEEVLSIYLEVGRDMEKSILDQLAFGL
ncbi:MAG: TdeIII family type II restriction endonuclease [Arthrospira platensis PCC 7345]|uniref:type II site-specific deoxyribonuclease n=1 Tax=Limnospira indica PCC 8005 TaxID=376219 RepID=A0A9P1KGM5_9CYAN|nr:TdeIII family type II restriction endonuclease [Limnospira indica]MDT9298105.1 TdeIII family type II restriction endonuclease [Arthrospira platensis PCC 7345]MDT9310478.1 TdeIII family type II restriction endonuclease [Limnospira sp. Paracas R14]CDM95086.1 Type-2 restriction enzyme Asp8005ORF0359 (Type II restriction enzyme) (Endonuclease) [Limnospira indica PCC 8005]